MRTAINENIPAFEYEKNTKEFTDFYYRTISSKWTDILPYYHENSICCINGVEMKPYELVCDFASHGILAGIMDNPSVSWYQIDDTKTMVVISGKMNLISSNRYQILCYNLIDSFVICNRESKILHHSMNIL